VARSPAPPSSSEVIHRPDPGLARGLWETTPVTLYVALAATVALATLYAVVRVRRAKRRAAVGESRGRS